jgi:hypothetical protein
MTPEKTEPPFISMPKPTAEPVLEFAGHIGEREYTGRSRQNLAAVGNAAAEGTDVEDVDAELLAESVPLAAFTTLPEKFATSEMRSA